MSDARTILQQRLANGEISIDEFDERLERLEGSDTPNPSASVGSTANDGLPSQDNENCSGPLAPAPLLDAEEASDPPPSPNEHLGGNSSVQPKSSVVFFGSAVVAVLVIAVGGFFALTSRAEKDTFPDLVEGLPRDYYALKDTNVRDGPTADNTIVVAQIPEGRRIRAKRVRDAGEDARWLELLEGEHEGRYVWETNFETSLDRSREILANGIARYDDDREILASNVGSILEMGLYQRLAPNSWIVSRRMKESLQREGIETLGNFLGFFKDSDRAFDIRIAIEKLNGSGAEAVANYSVLYSVGSSQAYEARFFWDRTDDGWRLETVRVKRGQEIRSSGAEGDELIRWLATT